ncbi:hypothetical protein BN871_IQ_00150 [Paenibacillus sp. P22]|nr:hypothetical protein BN871_IQ_00150 [Paenibacillus sp. P22]
MGTFASRITCLQEEVKPHHVSPLYRLRLGPCPDLRRARSVRSPWAQGPPYERHAGRIRDRRPLSDVSCHRPYPHRLRRQPSGRDPGLAQRRPAHQCGHLPLLGKPVRSEHERRHLARSHHAARRALLHRRLGADRLGRLERPGPFLKSGQPPADEVLKAKKMRRHLCGAAAFATTGNERGPQPPTGALHAC